MKKTIIIPFKNVNPKKFPKESLKLFPIVWNEDKGEWIKDPERKSHIFGHYAQIDVNKVGIGAEIRVIMGTPTLGIIEKKQ